MKYTIANGVSAVKYIAKCRTVARLKLIGSPVKSVTRSPRMRPERVACSG